MGFVIPGQPIEAHELIELFSVLLTSIPSVNAFLIMEYVGAFVIMSTRALKPAGPMTRFRVSLSQSAVF